MLRPIFIRNPAFSVATGFLRKRTNKRWQRSVVQLAVAFAQPDDAKKQHSVASTWLTPSQSASGTGGLGSLVELQS